MTDYPKHEWPDLNAFDWKQAITPDIYTADNNHIRRKITPETLYQIFKARLIKELVAENAAGNTSGFLLLFDAENKPPHNLSTAELQADAGRSTLHSEYCKARFNSARINSGYMDYPCTCGLPPKLVDSAL